MSPARKGVADLGVLLAITSSFCANTFPGRTPVELEIRFEKGELFKTPLVVVPARRPDEDEEGEGGLENGRGPVKCPGCAGAILKLLAGADSPLTGPAIIDALEDATGYKDGTITLTLAWLTGVGLLVNPPGVRPKGYRFNTGE